MGECRKVLLGPVKASRTEFESWKKRIQRSLSDCSKAVPYSYPSTARSGDQNREVGEIEKVVVGGGGER